MWVQVLLAEVAMVEEEIMHLERRILELKLHLDEEKKHTKEWELHHDHQQKLLGPRVEHSPRLLSLPPSNFRSQRHIRDRKPFLGLTTADIKPMSSASFNDEEPEIEKPNQIAEELIKCLISIFLKLNTTSSVRPTSDHEPSSTAVPKLTFSCMSSRGFMPKASTFNSKTPASADHRWQLDPYGVLSEQDGPVADVGPYKNFTHLTRSSLDMSRVSECLPAIAKLRGLMQRLCYADLTLLTYKQKLAFWINIYNACIMHAFLQHGPSSAPDKLLLLMNKAVVNVGGIVLNALAIEHFILRHPPDLRRVSDSCLSQKIDLIMDEFAGYAKEEGMDEKEALLRHAYGLGYPEPNVTFALCRGGWTSPALRVYTAEDVVSELERAKVEYLQASVGVSCNKRKIMVPKLLHWHMRDFADDLESLLEWTYSQLPSSSGPLKRSIMECLNNNNNIGDHHTKMPVAEMVQFQPYESEFRYLLAM
ncbi:hypothetical protein ACLOJK_029978 [Asimina triloba]